MEELTFEKKKKVLMFIEHSPDIVNDCKIGKKDNNSKVHFEHVSISLVILSVILILLETDKDFSGNFQESFFILEAVFSLVFSIEYLLRIWTADANGKYNKSSKQKNTAAKFKYVFSPMGLVDLLSFLPFYLLLVHVYIFPLELGT